MRSSIHPGSPWFRVLTLLLLLPPPPGSLFPALKPSDTLFKVVFWLGYFNSCINPMIYPCSSQEFRRAFTRLLRCRCQRRRRRLRRFYDQRWRTAVKGIQRDHRGGGGGASALRGSTHGGEGGEGGDGGSLVYATSPSTGGSLRFKGWRLFPPLQTSSLQLREKMNSLSRKITTRGRGGRGAGGAVGGAGGSSRRHRNDIDTVSMGMYGDVCEPAGYQVYDFPDCFDLKETDI